MENESTMSVPFLNVLLNTPDTDHDICDFQMRNYLESIAKYIECETQTTIEAAMFIRERKSDFE